MASQANETFDKLLAHYRETALLSSIEGLVTWDHMTYLPPKGVDYRSEQIGYLAGLIHRRRTDKVIAEWLEELVESDLASDPHSQAGCTIREIKRNYDRSVRVPVELVEEIARVGGHSHVAWVEAKKTDNFAHFQPWLEKMLELRRLQAEAIGYESTPYDALLEEFEPGETTEQVSTVLEGLRDELAPLVAAIVDSGKVAPGDIVRRRYPAAIQEKFGKQAAADIGFCFESGRLDVTAHPFCGGAGPNDVRLTTRYDENDFVNGFFSIIHEAGHGVYEQGLPKDQFGLPPGESVSLGIHESQSRMWENLVGRSRGFWQYFFPSLCEAFPEATKDVTLDDWHAAVNDSRPSLIRTESDEATYNLHIIIRFELERAMIEGDLSVADLPAAWNDAYEKTLGVRPEKDSDGVLQDVHWCEGMFGYFPTYSLGNLYASQMFDQANEELGPLDEAFAKGEFAPLLEWLRSKVHQHGQCFTPSELIQNISGKPLSHEPLMKHLKTKFGELYELS